MQEAEVYIGGEQVQPLSVLKCESAAREMEHVVSRCLPSFYRNSYRLPGNTADAEDAVQDALLSAYKHLDQFRGQAQMSTWLSAIVSNSALMHLRKRPRQMQVSLGDGIGEEQEYSASERLGDRRPTPEDGRQSPQVIGSYQGATDEQR
jgi:RNA polymerase sigma-70 factor (ECF subfamily)